MSHSKLLIASLVLFTTTAPASRSSVLETNSVAAAVQHDGGEQDLTTPEVVGIVGQWESRAFGHQTLTTRPDGTATISMTLTPLAIPIYGRKIELDLEWTLDGRYLTQRIVGGSPERSVKKLIQKYGDTHEYLLVEYDAGQLVVKDTNGLSEPVRWTAIKPAP